MTEYQAAKKKIRQKSRNLREELSGAERQRKSSKIAERVVSHASFQNAKQLLIYMHYGSEVQTDGIIREAIAAGKRVYVPKVLGNEMEFYRIASLADCSPGYRGILEPETAADVYQPDCVDSADATLMILPGLAFDHAGLRIGYGGGFYDRYLAKHPGIVKLGIAYAFQYIEQVSAEETDIPVDLIVTEERTIQIG